MDLPPLSPLAQQMMTNAARECSRRKHFYLGVEHLFASLAAAEGSALDRALASNGVERGRFVDDLMKTPPANEHPIWGPEILFTPRCREVLRLAAGLAARAGAARVDPGHLIEAILREGRSTPIRRLRADGVNLTELHEAILQPAPDARSADTPALDKFGRDLTARAAAGLLSPMVARENELAQVAQALLRKSKNNPVLLGEAGVGKTAVVEGLAQLLISAECPLPLKGFRVIELSMAALVAGTRYRGDFEERLLEIVREASSAAGIVLFLDEMHALMGAGATEGAMDASSILKPSLARGEIRCIGATTISEYRRWIESDAALDRRFEKILVEEPSMDQARRMVEAASVALSEFHQVEVTSAAVSAALELTVRYVPQRRLPDKAIDALDESCARAILNRRGDSPATPAIGEEEIARTVAQWTGIPMKKISGDEARRLLHLEEQIQARVIGQGPAVSVVSRAIVTARAGLSDPNRPQGVFLFLGPTGVGKTELARSLAELVFGAESRLIRFDMSEFTEAHSVAGLLGAPPGYVGHEKEGRLVSAIRTTPHCVVLFDEVEKAHPRVFDLFLQIFDEGKVTSADGMSADFRNCIVILTSNLDVRPLREKHVGFVEEAEPIHTIDARAALEAHFRPELINRIDEIVPFRPLGPQDLRKILQNLAADLTGVLSRKGMRLEIDDAAQEWLIARSEPERFGARELRRVLDRFLRQPLAAVLLQRDPPPEVVRVSAEERGLRFD